MKFTCQRTDIIEAMGVVVRAVGSNNTLPVLDNVLIEAKADSISFTTTDLDIALSHSFPAQVAQPGSFTVPAKRLNDYLSFLSDETVTIELAEGDAVTVKSGKAKSKIKGIIASEYPSTPVVEPEFSITMLGKELSDGIKHVIFAASSNSIRPVLSGILLLAEGSTLTLAGTDSYRLSEIKLALPKEISGEVRAIIPARTMGEIQRLARLADGDVQVLLAKNQIQVIMGKVRLISRIIDGNYPDYEKIIPKSFVSHVTCSKNDLILALKRLNVFAKDNNYTVKIALGGGALQLTTDPSLTGEQETELPADIEGGDAAIALNSQYLLDILGVLDNDRVALHVGQPGQPVSVRGNSDRFIGIIMPLKI